MAIAPTERRDDTQTDGPRVVLLADDEPCIRGLAAAVLRRHGYEVLLAADGAEAVETYRREGRRIGVVILDLVMPRVPGWEALRQIVALDPGVLVLLSSAYADIPSAELDLPQVCGALPKPYRPAELVQSVRTALRAG